MRVNVLLFLLLVTRALGFVADDPNKTVTSDGSATDTQNAINYADGKNADGWTIIVGVSGGSYTWAATVNAPSTLSNNYTIQGAGTGVTITSSHNNYQSIGLSVTNGKLARITNFTFRNTGAQGGGFLVVDQPQASVAARNAFRVDHCTFQDCASFAIRIGEANMNEGTAYGLIDNCTFSNTTTSNGIYVFAGNNANQWNGNMTWGTEDTVTIEDCTFTLTATTVEGNPAIDSAYNGARWSARYNVFNNWVCVLHGADSAPTSTLQVEFHHNVTTVDDPVDYGLYCRGGCIMASDNDFLTTGAGAYNQSFKFANDSPGGFQKVGQGAVSGVATRLGAYFWGNRPQALGGAPGLALGTDYFATAPGPGLPTTSYTELAHPHPLRGSSGDTSAPTPNPMTFATVPGNPTNSAISMVASVAADAGSPPVQYFFHETTGGTGGSDSGWQSVTSYTDSGLAGGTTYSYQVKARDAASNETSYSGIFSATTTGTPGGTYYVDQSAGSDANPGTQAQPWKNCPGMHGTAAYTGSGSLVAGDTVYLDKSDTWQVSSAGDGGLTMVAGVHYVGNSYNPSAGGGVRAIIRANGTCEAGGIRMNADHATIPTWVEGIEVDGNGNSGSGIDINHRFWSAGMTRAVKRVQNCYVHGWTGNGGAGVYRYGIIVSDGSPDASGMVSNVEFLDNILTSAPRDGICLYPGATGRVTNILVRGNTVSGIRTDASYGEGHAILVKGDVQNAIIEYNYCHDVNSSALFINGPETGTGPGPSGIVARFNILHTDDNNGVIRSFGTGTKQADIYGNLVIGNSVTGGFSQAGDTGTFNYNVYNNTFMLLVDIGDPSATGTLNFRNNIIATSSSTPLLDSGSDIDTHTNNTYFRSGGGTLVTSGGTSYNSASITTYEPTGLSSNPSFLNSASPPTGFTGTYPAIVPNTNGLSLNAASASVNSGADLGVSFNTSITGVTRSAPWDRGAYELVAGPLSLASSTISPAGNQIVLNFSQAVQAGSGGNGGWTLAASGGPVTVTFGGMTGAGSNALTYPLSRSIQFGETVTVSYVQPTNGIEDLSGNDLASLANQAVTNSSTQGQTVATPVITLAAGTYSSAQTTTITDATAGAVIRYTSDGSTPTSASPAYSSAISIPSTMTIKAIGTKAGGYMDSAVASSLFTINIVNPTGTRVLGLRGVPASGGAVP